MANGLQSNPAQHRQRQEEQDLPESDEPERADHDIMIAAAISDLGLPPRRFRR